MANTRFQPGNSGGNPKGRPKGVPNKTTADIKALAFKSAPEAIAILVQLMRTSAVEATRLAAANALLDRGIGRPRQPITGEGEGPVQITHVISWQKDDSLAAEPPPPKSDSKGTIAWQTSQEPWH
jgi:Family of unknown function (DUF5681)